MENPNFLSYEQLKDYNGNGYLVLRQVFTALEAAAWRQECERLLGLEEYIDRNNLSVGYRNFEDRAVIEKFDPVRDISPVFHALEMDERILSPLRDIYLDDTTPASGLPVYGFTMERTIPHRIYVSA